MPADDSLLHRRAKQEHRGCRAVIGPAARILLDAAPELAERHHQYTVVVFLLLWAKVAHEDIVSRANGSTFLEISKANFRPIAIVAPAPKVMQAFDRLARPLYERIGECARESRALAAIRDSLLPKLISGELSVESLARCREALA